MACLQSLMLEEYSMIWHTQLEMHCWHYQSPYGQKVATVKLCVTAQAHLLLVCTIILHTLYWWYAHRENSCMNLPWLIWYSVQIAVPVFITLVSFQFSCCVAIFWVYFDPVHENLIIESFFISVDILSQFQKSVKWDNTWMSKISCYVVFIRVL